MKKVFMMLVQCQSGFLISWAKSRLTLLLSQVRFSLQQFCNSMYSQYLADKNQAEVIFAINIWGFALDKT